MIKWIAERINQEEEEGFTLIELLVVVIIIGILAAIAIPTFLSQRERGWQAELTSNVRNAALEVEAAATANNGVYPPLAEIDISEFNVAPVTLTYAQTGTPTGSAFTICGTHASIDGNNRVQYDSAQGGVQGFEQGAGATC